MSATKSKDIRSIEVAALARVEGEGGFYIGVKDGKVSDVKIVKGARYREFDKAAERAAKRERFEPATRNGVPVAHTIKYTYRFRLNS